MKQKIIYLRSLVFLYSECNQLSPNWRYNLKYAAHVKEQQWVSCACSIDPLKKEGIRNAVQHPEGSCLCHIIPAEHAHMHIRIEIPGIQSCWAAHFSTSLAEAGPFCTHQCVHVFNDFFYWERVTAHEHMILCKHKDGHRTAWHQLWLCGCSMEIKPAQPQ